VTRAIAGCIGRSCPYLWLTGLADQLLRSSSSDQFNASIYCRRVRHECRYDHLKGCPEAANRLNGLVGVDVCDAQAGGDDAKEAQAEEDPNANRLRSGPVFDSEDWKGYGEQHEIENDVGNALGEKLDVGSDAVAWRGADLPV
jgi:hypothetical protein